MREKSTAPKTRLSLALSQAARDRLQTMMDRTCADSMAEVVRRALSIYECILEQRAVGGKVFVRAGGKDRELLVL